MAHQRLQLYEALRASAPEKAQAKLELAKRMVVETMEQTRNLSMTLRQAEAEVSLEPALSELLEEALPTEVSHDLTVEGDETLLSPPWHAMATRLVLLRSLPMYLLKG